MDPRILIIDDEADILEMLKMLFSHKGYAVTTAQNAVEALKRLDQPPDIVLLDVSMPGMDGFALCRTLRGHLACPILFLTARVEDADKLAGFAAGGDDYIVKPFSTVELLARVEAHLRREQRQGGRRRVRFSGGLVIDYGQRAAFTGEAKFPLAKKEFDILELLSLHPGQVFDKEHIYTALWGYDGRGNSAVVAEHIRRIRAKLAVAGCEDNIETIWGVGYTWKP